MFDFLALLRDFLLEVAAVDWELSGGSNGRRSYPFILDGLAFDFDVFGFTGRVGTRNRFADVLIDYPGRGYIDRLA